MNKAYVALLTTTQLLVVININCCPCCCKNGITTPHITHVETKTNLDKKSASNPGKNNISKGTDKNILTEIDDEIVKTEQEEDFKIFKSYILENCNKEIDLEKIYLLFKFTKDNKIGKIKKIEEEEIDNSLRRCTKITINDAYICYFKQQSYSDKIYFDLLKEIGLLDYKYYLSKNYILTEHVEQNINNNHVINDDNLIIFDKDSENRFRDMISKIKNFKQYSFFCSLLRLSDCNLINRFDNSYFKAEGDRYKVLLLDVDNSGDTNVFVEGKEYEKFYDILDSNTKKAIPTFNDNRKIYTHIKEGSDYIPFLMALTISFTIFEDILYLDDFFLNILKKYSPNEDIENSEQLIHDALNDKLFVESACCKNEEFIYPSKKNYEYKYPKNFIFALYDMAKSFMSENKDEDKEVKFLDYILPLMWKYLDIERIVTKPKTKKYESINTLKSFGKAFIENYYKNKKLLIAVDRYYRSHKKKDLIFAEVMNAENFTNEENNEIKEDLKNLITFIKSNESNYDKEKIEGIKYSFNQLKANNMFPNIIKDVNF